jgi:hypothetical protein
MQLQSTCNSVWILADLQGVMLIALRSPTACVLLAFYSLAAVLGQGLHDWTCPDHATCSEHDHFPSAAAHPHEFIVEAAGRVEAADEPSHDPQTCPICQYRAQGQLSLLNDATIVRRVLVSEAPVDTTLPFLRPLYQPYGPRAPPVVRCAALSGAAAG